MRGTMNDFTLHIQALHYISKSVNVYSCCRCRPITVFYVAFNASLIDTAVSENRHDTKLNFRLAVT
jgi:hypothetical protein